jgi:hypothetical protein
VPDVGERYAGQPHARFDAVARGNPGPVGHAARSPDISRRPHEGAGQERRASSRKPNPHPIPRAATLDQRGPRIRRVPKTRPLNCPVRGRQTDTPPLLRTDTSGRVGGQGRRDRLGRRPEAPGETPALANEQSWRTAGRTRSLLSRTNRSSAISIAHAAVSRQ